MTTGDWVNFVEQLPEYTWVTLAGGEPFFFKEFDHIFSKVASWHQCNIINNGTSMTEDLI
tara:strand:+ start:277 stop:456 length:180 start_codon:yes stop_codon:yes gene_type:complete